MLVELCQLFEMDRTIASFECNAMLPPYRMLRGREKRSTSASCVAPTISGKPIFDALMAQTPSELTVEIVMFYQSEFGQKVNHIVIHGSRLSR